MKKTLLVGASLMLCMSSVANADTILGAKLGADFWYPSINGGTAQSGQVMPEPDYSSSGQGSFWVAVEHPVPLIPNVALRQNVIKDKGGLTGANETLNKVNITGDVSTKIDLSNTDFILYYEILDNDLVSLDLGGAYKLFHGSYQISNATQKASKDIDDGVFMGYANAEIGLPLTGLYAFAEVLAGINEGQVYDYNFGLGWQFDFLVVDTRLRLGYREFNFDVGNFSGVTSDMQFKGGFAGLELDF